MNSIIYVRSNLSKIYNEDGFLTRVKDRIKINNMGESIIKELGIKIAQIKLPPNLNKSAYLRNMETVRKVSHLTENRLAPKTFRIYDYNLFGDFQQRLFAYGVVRSIKLLLRIHRKSIKNSCVVIYDASDNINSNIIFELSKECRYLILLSKDIEKANRIREKVIADYGISPVVSKEISFASKKADFFITSRNIDIGREVPVWYLDNLYLPNGGEALAVNDVSFYVPWDYNNNDMDVELLGAALSQMGEKDIEAALKYNGVHLDKIKFNENVKL